METFVDRLEEIQRRINSACERVGRDPAEVNLLGVTKKILPDQITEASDAGKVIFGENRVQEAKQKIPLCPGHLEWHMIGHLQRNKVKDAVSLFSMIHSVDSHRLLETVNSAGEEAGKNMPVCLEINVSGESSKYGLDPDEVPALLEQCGSMMNVDVVGLMTMPPFTEDPEDARPHFKRLCELRDQWRESTGFDLSELSMGMTGDFEIAVEEGATWIRLGTILFGGR